jgi:hypothetical protein
MDQSIKLKMDQEEMISVKTGRRVRRECCWSPIPFKFYGEYLNKESLEGFGDDKIGGQVIRTLKYAEDFMLLAKEEAVLQSMIKCLNEIGSWCEMEKNEEKLR